MAEPRGPSTTATNQQSRGRAADAPDDHTLVKGTRHAAQQELPRDRGQDRPRQRCTSPLQAVQHGQGAARSTKFDPTVDVAMRLGVDPRKADQMVRGTVNLPHGTGKTARVLVFATGDKAEAALEAGADHVGSDDMVEKVAGGWLDFDAVVATPDMMGKVGRLGRVLGPRGLMPNPKTGTVTPDVAKAVSRDQGRQDRVPGRPARQPALHHRQGLVLRAAAGRELRSQRSTRCSGSSRPAPRAATCAR